MGAENPSRPNDFSDTPPSDTTSFSLNNNLYWNGGEPIPSNSSELINYTDDAQGLVVDPKLPFQAGLIAPRWQENLSRFAEGSATIRAAFLKIVKGYGVPANQSAALDSAEPVHSAAEDILGQSRPVGDTADIGAFEFRGSSIAPEVILLLSPKSD